MIVYTTGYLGERTNPGDGKAARLRQMVLDLGVLLVDIRHVPWSKAPCWRKASLEALLGDRYVHVAELGNATKRTGSITIVDLEAGLDKVMAQPLPPLLLCCCPVVWDCHRKIVAEALRERPGVETVTEILHWGPFRKEDGHA